MGKQGQRRRVCAARRRFRRGCRIRAGAHVTRAVELYHDRFISYSGGNFATYGISGIAPIFKIITDKQGRFVSGNIIPITQVGDKIPKIDPEKTVIERIIYLNHSDFPNGNGLDVSPGGDITRR